ncbi:hypothetical protein PIROE2DRAFT_13351 [Piromyces sp. E2]|nr:hypothetical protein PIROE2DRAFT_13351 [Piromyces sp. E2]|eukprot:OUM60796.1 hypothetical protein PIROE2DRAFT_13351 [Piromyces sp. E2]
MEDDNSDNPSLEELIRKLYDALNDNQTQALPEQIYSYKALLQTLLQACLLTPLKHKEQELTEIQLKQALTTLKLINHAIQKIPEIIVYSTQCPLNSTPENSISFSQLYVPLKKNKFIVPCFECWLITRLTLLLFEEKFKSLYHYIIEIIFLIFKILLDKSENYILFRNLFQDYINFFKEILSFYLETKIQYPLDLICLKNKKEELESSLPKDNKEEIQNLSCNLSSVIENIFRYTIQYSNDFSHPMIAMLIHNLFIINKKHQLSEPVFLDLLKLCRSLVQLKVSFSINHLEQLYFITFSIMVIVFSYSEEKSTLKPKDQVEDKILIIYENYLSEILNNLNLLLDDLKANLIYNFVSDFWIILLDINHFQQFKTQELKKSLLSSFKIFLNLSNTLPSDQIIEYLIKILYHTQKDNAEIIIDCLIQYNNLKKQNEQKNISMKNLPNLNQQHSILEKKHILEEEEDDESM